MNDAIIPLIPHAPADPGNVSVPALKVLSEITTSLSTDANVEQLLGRFLSTMIRLSGAQAGAVRIITDDRMHLRLIGSVGLPPELVEQETLVSLDCGVCGKAAREVTVSTWSNVAFCKRQAGDAYFSSTCNSVVAVPLMHKNQVMGVYNLFMAEGRAVPDDVRLLFRSISEHLGIALENARLTRENMRISLMNERQMLANQIHDSLAQTLAYAKMRLNVLSDAMRDADYAKANRYLGDVEEAVDLAYADLRDLITQYRDRINPRGLVPAIQELAKNFRKKANADVDFLNLVQEVNISPDEEIQVFHIIQESLYNIAKHARARHVVITFDLENGQYLVNVADDGVGLQKKKDESSTMGKSFGLTIMRERAARLNGKLSIESRPAGGTVIRLTFPQRKSEQAA
ncbi:MAG TPA: GAF domain-containing protein [Thiobacillaceae bacterium]|nr:GAF domain-containing protein [Thiobacillaceae bacterium]